MDDKHKKEMRFSIGYFGIMLLFAWLFQVLIFEPMVLRMREVPYSEFLRQLEAGEVAQVTLGESRLIYTLHGAGDRQSPVYNVVRMEDPALIDRLIAAGVEFSAEQPASSLGTLLLGWLIPLLPLALIWYALFRRMQHGGMNVMSIGKSKAREIAGEVTGVKFKDVGGLEEVEVELREIIEFLKDPERFTRIGAKLPKGVLLVGPPGTGKTLLARATAGEAGVPFFSISGSDFVEMFVGVGAARVRDLFEQAKAKAPCIVFIDEIDAIGQSRASAISVGTNDEREQTLNQLLAEMDGFEANNGVVIMAATNRPEVLDKALLRPGRFDRQIQVVLPTEAGRLQILKIHTAKVPLAPDVNLERLAQVTAGFSGADLANIVNEAALLAVRQGREQVTMEDFDLAIERVVAGLQRRMALKPELKRRVAYHEGGHALVAQLLPSTDPVHKVSIIPTAKGALGYTMQMPEEDTYLLSKRELQEQLAVMLGGRAAEWLVFGDRSTGAANDLERVSDIARRMVTEFGMTETLGPVRYTTDAGMGYLGYATTMRQDVSQETARLIDAETRRIVEEAEALAEQVLREHEGVLHRIAEVLITKESITGDQIRQIVEQGAAA
ncbi:MAG TPA: ATP-dependent zinc metalloprotease FtsH [Anaerolineae bacterium]|nr:ATP-dependent zinc metalloprotease FtsH [Anaerolineae bacterium]HRU94104.1 ATP-dependent zinc metalloprotease FtsH [Anaerolineae bacterium]HXK42609.1 ATP-dependent zinc metalloprotease FtsH [Anaerolineae bacterium]